MSDKGPRPPRPIQRCLARLHIDLSNKLCPGRMPLFQLDVDDAWETLRKTAMGPAGSETLLSSLKAFRSIALHLEPSSGDRLENLGRRLCHIKQRRRLRQDLKQSSREGAVQAMLKHPAPTTIPLVYQPTSATATPGNSFRRSESSEAPPIEHTHDLTTSHDYKPYKPTTPGEIFILPSPPASHLSLQTILEGSDDEAEYSPATPRVPSPVLFVNPFGAPIPQHQQLPSPPPTPATSEGLPPHLNDAEMAEEALNGAKPTDLSGKIKKLRGEAIAHGGTSDIFYAQLDGRQRVAVKVLRTTNSSPGETVQRRLRREMLLWWLCKHRNIVPLLGFSADFGSIMALVSPWMKNGSAPSYIKLVKCSWAERLKLLSDVASGLEYLHQLQPPIVHGDLKPTNVLIADNGDACLCDFGLSRILRSEEGPSGFTTSNFAGSIRYMAPELLNDEDDEGLPLVMPASDVYAFGCVGLEIVMDHVPYANRNLDAQVMHDIIRGVLPARRPSVTTVAGKPSLSKLWDLLNLTWVSDPRRRPTIQLVSGLLAECRARPNPRSTMEQASIYQIHSHHLSSYSTGQPREQISFPLSRQSNSHASSITNAPPPRPASNPIPSLRLLPSRNLSTSHVQTPSITPSSGSSETLFRLRRSASAVLKGSLRKSSSRENTIPFRPSVSAAKQVWHDR